VDSDSLEAGDGKLPHYIARLFKKNRTLSVINDFVCRAENGLLETRLK